MKINTPTEAMNTLLRRVGSLDERESCEAAHELAVAFAPVIRQGIMPGDIVTDIYTEIPLAQDAIPEFPLDFVAPGTEGDYVAYTLTQHGRIPEKHVEGDYVLIPTYPIGSNIDFLLRYARMARWDIANRAMEVMKMGVAKKMNDDGWHVLLTAIIDRNIIVYDTDAIQGNFTKRLVTLARTIMARNGGGNATSLNHRELTDLYLSLEGLDDMRNWGIDQIDEVTRREIIQDYEGGMLQRVFGVNLHGVWELGIGQEYQLFFTNVLGATLPNSDVELVVGLDLRNQDSFIMPTRGQLEVYDDPQLHRQQRQGMYCRRELGWGVLDNRSVIAASF